MTNKEAVAKVIFWRFIISIPLSTVITYYYFGHLFKAVAFVVLMNAIMTVTHFAFEKFWPFVWRWYMDFKG